MRSLIPVHSQLLWESHIFKTHTFFSCFFSWPSDRMQGVLNISTVSFYTFSISPFLWSLSDSDCLFFADCHKKPPWFSYTEPLAWRSEGIMSSLTFCGSPLLTEISQCISQAFKLFIIWLQTFFWRLLPFVHDSVDLIWLLRYGYVFSCSQDSLESWCFCQCPNPIQRRLQLHLLHETLSLKLKALFSYCDSMTTLYLDHFLNISQSPLILLSLFTYS